MISDEEIKQRQEQLDSEEVIYEWEAIYPAIVGKNGKLIRFCIGIVPALIMGIAATWFLVVQEKYIVLIPAYLVLFFCAYLVYGLQLADNKCRYQLTKKGVITYTQQHIPEIVYAVFRNIAWIGIGVCALAAAVVGPMVFVGAGAFALMSFSFRDFKPKVDKENIIFSDYTKIYDVYEDGYIMFACSPYLFSGKASLFYNNLEEKNLIMEYLINVLDEPDFMRVKSTKDVYQDDFIKIAFKLHNDIYGED
ncbi:hypothetical protein [Vibrio rumoiensis]|uniref:hypothetical protein n=1 Tax=Vibrio rumoiensis TaxID=76258 RepID=UPI003AA8662A